MGLPMMPRPMNPIGPLAMLALSSHWGPRGRDGHCSSLTPAVSPAGLAGANPDPWCAGRALGGASAPGRGALRDRLECDAVVARIRRPVVMFSEPDRQRN